jgi:hypothetical protein
VNKCNRGRLFARWLIIASSAALVLGNVALLQFDSELLRKIRVHILCKKLLDSDGGAGVASARKHLPLSQSSCQYAARSFSEPSPGSGQSVSGNGKGYGVRITKRSRGVSPDNKMRRRAAEMRS